MERSMLFWVTRTRPFNLMTAQRLRAMGHEALAAPLFEISPLAPSERQQRPELIAFTSVNGVRHHPYRSDWQSIPVFAVGDTTAAAARRRGYHHVHSANGNVQDLQALILGSAATGGRLVHFCAREAAGDLASYLRRRGFEAERHNVYEAVPRPLHESLSLITGPPRPDGIIVHSGKGAQRIAELVAETGWSGHIFCLARSHARAFEGIRRLTVEWAARPTERGLMERIRQVTIPPVGRLSSSISASRSGRRAGDFELDDLRVANDNFGPAPTPA